MEVLVLTGYRAQKEGELSLAPGDLVRQVCAAARGWLRGELGGRRGLFPAHLVQKIPETLRCAGEPPRPRCARRRGDPAKSRGPKRWCKVNFSYNPEQPDELRLQAGEIVEMIKEIEDGWWLGKKNGQLGAFPSNFVDLLQSGPPSLGNPDMPSAVPGLERPSKLSAMTYDSPPDYLRTVSQPEIYRVLFDYQPEAPDELALRRGDVVKVLRKITEDKGWWEGESQGRRGVFPDNFVLPPPPVKKLTPRRVIPRDSAPIKEPKPKRLMPRSNLPAVKKLTTPTGPSKVKPFRIPSGDSLKRSSRDQNSSSSFLISGSSGHTGRKRPKAQVSRQRSAASPEQKHSSLSKSPPLDKTLDTTSEKTQSVDALTPAKALTPDKIPSPEKTLVLEDQTPAPEEALTGEDKVPTPEKTPTLEDRVPTPDKEFSVDETPTPEVPLEDEVLDSKGAPTLETTLTLGQVLQKEASVQDRTEQHHLSPEEAAVPGKPLVTSEAQSHEAPKSEEGPLLMEERSPNEGGGSPTQPSSPVQSEPTPASGETHTWQEDPALEAAPTEGDTTLEAESSKEEVPPQKAEALHKPASETATLPDATDSQRDLTLKDEVESLKRSLEQMGVQLETKLNQIWEELKKERVQRERLEVHLQRASLEPGARSSVHTQTESQLR